MPEHNEDSAISFGPFRLFPKSRLLEKEGSPLHVGGRALDILIFLAERPGVVVDKRELVKRIWADVNVDEGSLRFHVAALRKAFGDTGKSARYVVNVPGRGYCFVASLAQAAPPVAPVSSDIAPPRLPVQLAKMIGREEVIEKISNGLSLYRFMTVKAMKTGWLPWSIPNGLKAGKEIPYYIVITGALKMARLPRFLVLLSNHQITF